MTGARYNPDVMNGAWYNPNVINFIINRRRVASATYLYALFAFFGASTFLRWFTMYMYSMGKPGTYPRKNITTMDGKWMEMLYGFGIGYESAPVLTRWGNPE